MSESKRDFIESKKKNFIELLKHLTIGDAQAIELISIYENQSAEELINQVRSSGMTQNTTEFLSRQLCRKLSIRENQWPLLDNYFALFLDVVNNN